MTSLRRVVIALVILGVALAVPVGALVIRALETAAIEQENRHRLLAERVFDEMEDSLSRFLEAEEARPFNAYRLFADEPSAVERSPLSQTAALPFIVGHFQIDPDGSLHTPRAPSPEATILEASLRAAWQASARPPERVAMQVPEAKPKRSRPGVLDALGGPVRGVVAPGQRFSPDVEEDLEEKDVEKSQEQKKDSYEVYRRLNRSQALRAERKQKVTIERTLGLAPAQAPAHARPQAFAMPLATRPGAVLEPDERGAAAASGVVGATLAGAFPAAPRRPSTFAAMPARSAVVRIALDPMLGRSVSDDRLLLYRTVVVGEQGYRQGLLVDWRLLGSWLESEVLTPSGLSDSAQLQFFGNQRGSLAGGYSYEHRFAEPFDAFGAQLRLAALPSTEGTGTIYALAALLALVAAGGGVAVYRMVSVAVQFAERRSRFAASVSHELKTPLTSIRMYAEMLRDGLVPNDRKREEYYHTITDESERLSRLIDNVLDFSRLEKGEYEIRRHRGPVLPVVREALAKLAPHVERQGFELSLEADESLPDVDLDRDALTQVVFNLVDNAVKYARSANNKRIVVGCRVRPGDTGHVEVDVRDHGPGVPNKELGRIFEPFFRREDELTRTTKGTGIGLALVKELVESLGGRVTAENVEDGGFRVRVSLSAA